MGWLSFGSSAPKVITATEILKDLEKARTDAVALTDSLTKISKPLGLFAAIRIAHKAEALNATFLETAKHLTTLSAPPSETKARQISEAYEKIYTPFQESIDAIRDLKDQFDRLKIGFVVEQKIGLLKNSEGELAKTLPESIPTPLIIEKVKEKHDAVLPGILEVEKLYAGSPVITDPKDIPRDGEGDAKAAEQLTEETAATAAAA